MAHWFIGRGARDNFTIHLEEFKGKPFRYLEIGVFEADSLKWVVENIATHPDARCFGVDPYVGMRRRNDRDMAKRWRKARRRLRGYKNVKLYRSYSVPWLKRHARKVAPFDVIYIDGDHHAIGCLTDTVLCWSFLNVGGLMIWDDYALKRRNRQLVRPAVDGFISCLETHQFENLQMVDNYQRGIRKLAHHEIEQRR